VDEVPRISLEKLPPELRERLQPRVERLGYLGEFFQVAAHQPAPLEHFVDWTEALKEALDWRLVEAIALTVASATANEYERVQHERLALRLGMAEETVRGLVDGSVAGLGCEERAAVALAREVVEARGRDCSRSFDELLDQVGPAVAVGCLMTATRYLAHSTMSNTWGVRAPVSSPLEHGVANV
jgi:alkylhydroperoxidase family enzyme